MCHIIIPHLLDVGEARGLVGRRLPLPALLERRVRLAVGLARRAPLDRALRRHLDHLARLRARAARDLVVRLAPLRLAGLVEL